MITMAHKRVHQNLYDYESKIGQSRDGPRSLSSEKKNGHWIKYFSFKINQLAQGLAFHIITADSKV